VQKRWVLQEVRQRVWQECLSSSKKESSAGWEACSAQLRFLKERLDYNIVIEPLFCALIDN
jgi:hypothetical protein